jgi:MFS superfamily sulfate permease-like transporter
MRFVPGLQAAREYRREWLRDDLVAGTVLTALLIPQGMAYAGLAGLPPIAGVYATLVPLLAYAVFGPSRIMVIAPDSAIAPLIAAAIIPLAAADPDQRMGVAALLALMVGALCLVGGIARLGFVTDLLSKPVRVGYLAGIAIVVLADQAAKMLGIDIEAEDFLGGIVELLTSLDETVALTAAIGLGTFVALLAIRWRFPRVPGALLAVIAGIGLVVVLDLQDTIPTVGEVPAGLPTFGCHRSTAICSGRSPFRRWPLPSSRLPTRASCRAASPVVAASGSTRTRSSSPSAPRTWPSGCSRATRSRAARLGRLRPRRPGRRPS